MIISSIFIFIRVSLLSITKGRLATCSLMLLWLHCWHDVPYGLCLAQAGSSALPDVDPTRLGLRGAGCSVARVGLRRHCQHGSSCGLFVDAPVGCSAQEVLEIAGDRDFKLLG